MPTRYWCSSVAAFRQRAAMPNCYRHLSTANSSNTNSRSTRGDVLTGIARFAIAAPRRVIALALLVMIGTATFGIPVAKSLSAGGGLDPGAESSQASALLSDKFEQGDMTLVLTVTSDR